MTQDDARPIPLETFARVQDSDGRLDIVDGGDGRPQVIATGRTGSGLKVEWREGAAGSPAEQRVAARFLASLTDEYGPRISGAVAAELGLREDKPGLEARTVKDALRLAETQRDVFSGANFFVELHCSPVARTPAFRAACQAAGIDAASLEAKTLALLDERFRAALTAASQKDQQPLSAQDGEQLLARVITTWKTDVAAGKEAS